MKKIDWKGELTGVTGSVAYDYYNPNTGEKLNSTEICSDATIQVKLPLNITANGIDMDLYTQYSSAKVNIYDRKSAYYNSRCLTFVNSTLDGDITIGERRISAPNVSIACSDGCQFQGIDTKNYIICNCVPSNETEVKVTSDGSFVNTISSSNLEIIMCTTQAFDPEIIYYNPGFWCNGSFILTAVSLVIIFNILTATSLSKSLTTYIYHDGLFYKQVYFPNEVQNLQTIENKIQDIDRSPANNVLVIQKNQIVDSGTLPKPNPPKETPIEVGSPKDGQSIRIEEYSKLNENHISDNLNNQLKISNPEALRLNDLNKNSNFANEDNLKNEPQVASSHMEENKIKINFENVSGPTLNEGSIKNGTNSFTYLDYINMTYDEILAFDQRSFFNFYLQLLLNSHIFLRAFFLKTFLVPQSLRIISFFLVSSFSFALNAIFYSDTYIQERTQKFSSVQQNNFSYVISYQLAKSVWSVIIGTIPIILLKLLLIVPRKDYYTFNESLKKNDLESIKTAKNHLYSNMMMRYVLFVVLSFVLHMFCWYYVTAFCGVYIKSSVSWVCGGILSLIINLVIVQFSLPLIHTIARTLARRFPKSFLTKYFYISCRIIL
jgi:hypothetical protein